MSSDFKYIIEKNKSKILIGLSVLLLAGIGFGAYFLLTDEKIELLKIQEQEKKLADYIISASKDGVLNLVDTESGEVKESLNLPVNEYVYTLNNAYDTLYVYDGKKINTYDVSKGKFTDKGIVAEVKVENPETIKADGENIAILSDDKELLTYVYQKDGKQKTEKITLQNKVDDFHISNETLIYSTQTNLHSFSPTTEASIDLGDETKLITTFQNQVLIHNKFGSGLDNNVLMTLNYEDLEITGLSETKSADTNLLPMDEGDEVFYTTQYITASDPYHLLDEWKIQDGNIVKEQDITVKVPVKKDGVAYNDETTIASKGYMYTHYQNRIIIFDIKSHKLMKEISVDEYFATPVLSN